MHAAQGKYDDAAVTPPAFYGQTDWGRLNMKVITRPDVASSEWQCTYLHLYFHLHLM